MAGKSILNIFVWYRTLFLKVNNVICRRLKRKINEENKFLLVWYLKILKWQKVGMFMKNCTSESNIESSDTIYNFLFFVHLLDSWAYLLQVFVFIKY